MTPLSPQNKERLETARNEARKRVIARGIVQFRADKEMMDQLLQISDYQKVPVGTLVRQWLAPIVTQQFINIQIERQAILTPHEATKAEQLFTQALRCKEMISKLPSMSNERIRAESDYSMLLQNANALFVHTSENSRDSVLLKHIRLRLDQIALLCNEETPAVLNKKPKKKAV